LENGKSVEREKLLAEVLNVLEENLQKIKKSPGSILSEWRKNCSTIGDRITIQQGDTTKSGIFDDIDDEGYLLLKTGKKIEKISLGDVSAGG
jgi:BirA family biotin operon repressor/biotin-[acetyl-CoA-carboxylase] ligase